MGEPTGEYYDVILVFGIIDILQDYDISKKLEHAYKSFQYDPSSISAVDPRQYSKRFRDFIYKIFTEDTWINWDIPLADDGASSITECDAIKVSLAISFSFYCIYL